MQEIQEDERIELEQAKKLKLAQGLLERNPTPKKKKISRLQDNSQPNTESKSSFVHMNAPINIDDGLGSPKFIQNNLEQITEFNTLESSERNRDLQMPGIPMKFRYQNMWTIQ